MERALLAHYLTLLAQVLRAEEVALRAVLAKVGEEPTRDELLALGGAVRAALLEQASMALMLATWLEGSEGGEVEQ